jgi:glycosyltransferase involved in cell wall biosynthesis
LIRIAKPDLVLVQSDAMKLRFAELGCAVRFLPPGINLDKFKPLSNKKELRRRYGVPEESYVVLHVGHIKKGRNVETLVNVLNGIAQVVFVGSPSSVNRRLYRYLTNHGCIVWTRYFPFIEEIYNLADCYVFPTFNHKEAIQIPLSVIEAMACNLPVITTKFGGLTDLFEPTDGLCFIETLAEMPMFIKALSEGEQTVNTRSKVIDLSWPRIAREMLAIYGELIQ